MSPLRIRSATTYRRSSSAPVPAVLALASLFVVGLQGCGGDDGPTDPPPPPPPPENPAPSLSGISPTSAEAGSDGFTLTVSGSGFVQGSTVHWNGSSRATTFGSATQLTASIAAGDVASAGSADITIVTPAPGGGTSQAASFTIEPAAVASVDVDPDAASLLVGEVLELSATPRSASGAALTDRAVNWDSDAPEVAEVDEDGVVTAIAPGTATITATSEGVSGEATIEVSLVPVATVEVDPESGSLVVGETLQLTATPLDDDDTPLEGREVTWESDDPDVAEVDEDGLVTAIAPGSATITATSEGVSGEATIDVSVVPVATVEVEPESESLIVDETLQLTAIPLDEDGTPLEDRDITWASDDPEVAEVDEDGVVTAIAPGSVTITATSEGVSGEATIEVTSPPAEEGTWAAISAGMWHTCTYTSAGTAYCWGEGVRVGDGSSTNRFRPTPVSGGHEFLTLTAGIGHTCGVTTAGEVWCWGENHSGEIGDGTTIDRRSPVRVSGLEGATAIGTGSGHSCALTGDAAYCWGWNGNGQIGDGTMFSRSTPVPVSGGHSFRSLAIGGLHSCALTDDTTWCWGAAEGAGTSGHALTPVELTNGDTFVTVSSGHLHACGLTADGEAFCWGYNHRGQVGNGTTTDQGTPAPVAGGHRFAAISAGGAHTCALTEEGEAWCWGNNTDGALGDGSTIHRMTPVAVAGDHRFRSISTGLGSHTCALDMDGDAWCWGDNARGMLGTGSSSPMARVRPTRVADPL